MERVASIVEEGVHQTETRAKICVLQHFIYSFVTLVDGIDVLTIFTVSSYEDFLWARHKFFMTNHKNDCAGSLRGGSGVWAGGRSQVAKPCDKPVSRQVLKNSSHVQPVSSARMPKPNTRDSSQATSQECVLTAAALD